MIEVRVLIPEDRLSALYAAVAELTRPTSTAAAPAVRTWNYELAVAALALLSDLEKSLLLRVIEVPGRRVPLSELAATLGLPADPAPLQDFPYLAAFCDAKSVGGAGSLTLPVVAGGSGSSAWYWVDPDVAVQFVSAANA